MVGKLDIVPTPARSTVLPLPKMSQAAPKRGLKSVFWGRVTADSHETFCARHEGEIGQAGTDLDRPSRLIGVEIAHFVDGRMRSPDIFPAYAGSQGYPRRDAPSILREGGMPLLAPLIGIVAGDDASAEFGAPI